MFKNNVFRIVIGIALALLALWGIYHIPFVNDKLAWRVEGWLSEVRIMLNPPSEQVFVPETIPTETRLPTPQVDVTLPPFTETPTPVLPTPTATISPTPLPARADLKGDRVYTDQKNRWNYCGPANLVMALKFWGWKGLPGKTDDLRDQVSSIVKPGFADSSKNFIDRGRLDLNVMPYELADFVTNHTDYSVVFRHGGDLNTLKALLVAGFPSIIEKGYYEIDTRGKRSWMGHYLFVTGYDDAEQVLIVQDAYYLNNEKPRKNRRIAYDELLHGWRAFNYLFLVVYPSERESDLKTTLGNWNDPQWAYQHALEQAETDIQNSQGMDQFFALFNKGTNYVQQMKYPEAGAAYDQAFSIYASLTEDDSQRPYRMMWYQTGPYWAYFYTGRYRDVINLANVTLSTPSTGPTLEESLYWRAMAEYALGDKGAAVADIRETIRLNPNFAPGLDRLREWGG